MHHKLLFTLSACLSLAASIAADPQTPAYENNFQTSEIGKTPEDMLVLEGAFAVRESGTNRFLELPGAPLDTFGVLFGPAEREEIAVSARIYGTNKGRRMPAFALGLNGVAGYKLQVSAAKRTIEIYRAETLMNSIPYEWTPGQWTHLELRVAKKGGAWHVIGRVHTDDGKRLAAIEIEDPKEPPPGRASVWGNPFSGTPIRFDDLKVWKISDNSSRAE